MENDTRKSYQKSEEQVDFENQLTSQRGCFQQEENVEKESSSSTMTRNLEKPLPLIDLFLNPKRKSEREDILKEVHREESGKGHKEV